MKDEFVKVVVRGAYIGLALSVLLSAAAAPEKDSKDKSHQDAFMPGNGAENDIAREVRHQLLLLPYYGVFDDIAFNVTGGTVTLLGAVTQPVLKDDAGRAAKSVKGVTQVNNQIEVLPLSPMDDQIRRAVYRAIYGQPGIDTRYGFRSVPSIHILVKNGHVTLEGLVASKADKDLINVAANGVPNVFSVANDLQIANSDK